MGAAASTAISLNATPDPCLHVNICRTAFGKALLRERLKLGPRRWALQRKLAVLNHSGEADWDSGSEKGASGLTRVGTVNLQQTILIDRFSERFSSIWRC